MKSLKFLYATDNSGINQNGINGLNLIRIINNRNPIFSQ